MPSFLLYTHRLAATIAAAAVCFLAFASIASAASVTLAWDQPDSSAVKGYHIYYGPSDEGSAYRDDPKVTISSADQTQCVIEGLEPGVEYLFAATSHDNNSNQSDFSEEIAYEVPVSTPTHDAEKDEGEETDPPMDPEEKTGPSPHEPELADPADFIVVDYGIPITLMADVYSHPEGSVHYFSHWQIRRVDMKKPVYEASSEVDLLIHDVSEDLEEGLKYAWRVGFQDIESGKIAWSDERTFVVGEKALQNGAPPVEAGRSINDYRMVSFGHWAENACSKEVFGSLLDPNHKNNDYRILAYDPNSDWRPNPSWDGGYRDYGDFDVVPGRAYWVLARHGMDLDREGVSVTTTEDIFVALDYNPSNGDGWTMIAAPNNAEYHWGNMEIVVHDDEGEILYGPMPIRQLAEDNPYIDTRLWEWDRPDARYEVRDSAGFKMKPHGGYWARARAENVSLSFPYDMQVSRANPKTMISGWFHAGIEWIDENILPRAAYANFDAAGQESPPMPASGLEETHDPGDGSGEDNDDSDGEPGCFIRSISGGKTTR